MHDTDHTTTPRRRHRGRRRLTLLSAATVVAVLGAGCTIDRDPLAGWDLPEVEWIAELRPADCDTLVQAAAPTLRAQAESSWAEPDDAGSGWFGGGDDQAVSADGAGDAAVPTAPAAPMAPAERSALAQPETGPPTTMAEAAAGQAGGDDASVVIGTNNQEVAVDESDLVKTDGRRLVSIVNGVLRVVVLDDTPTIDSTLDLRTRGATELFLRGDTALVLGTTYRDTWYGDGIVDDTVVWEEPSAAAAETVDPTIAPTTVPPTTAAPTTFPPTTVEPTTTVPTTTAPTTVPSSTAPSPTTTVPPTPSPFPVATTLTLVSLADPTAPQVVASSDVEGSLVTARDAAGRARVVVQSTPVAAEQLSMATTRSAALAAVDGLDEVDLLPRMATGGRVQPLGACDDVLVAPALSPAPDTPIDRSWSAPLGTVTVLTVGDDLVDLQPVSVQGNAETVYASTASLYVAAASWDQGGSRTDVHRFSLAGDGPASYTGSGRAPGHLLNQFSLSERGGALRLVTTLDGGGVDGPTVDGPAIGGPAGGPALDMAPVGASSARLTVLDTDGTLDEIGHLDGMGIGEQVQSVRFMDDLAYVVTFRQVDPLYALDLSDPRAPRLLGELKIPGFSEYLHPVGEGLLLGVGREVDPDTGIDEGLKVSLFDVSDPLTMREIDQIVLPMARSEVSADHRAFLWDPSRRQAVVPVELSGCDMTGRCDGAPGGAALVLRADRDGLVEVGRFAHEPLPGWSLQPNRTVLVDDDLWSVSIASIGRTDADAPTGAALLRF